ncbi:MAG: hypothetical protein PHS14_18045, partial [Elusimicrobia bacterium]|nr:hypothetical protein [Elusimicrobiota bacterium]
VLGHLPHPIVARAAQVLDKVAVDLAKANGVEKMDRNAPVVKMFAWSRARNQLKRERRAARG